MNFILQTNSVDILFSYCPCFEIGWAWVL